MGEDGGGGWGAVLAGCLIAWLVCFLFGWCFRCSVAWHCVGRWVVWLNGRFVGFLRVCLLDWLVACLVSCLPFLFVFVVCFGYFDGFGSRGVGRCGRYLFGWLLLRFAFFVFVLRVCLVKP